MTTYVMKSRVARPVSPREIKEAARALAHQRADRPPSDAIRRALWLARALPVAIDVLFDERAWVAGSTLRPMGVEADPRRVPEGALEARSMYKQGDETISVYIGSAGEPKASEAFMRNAACVVHFARNSPEVADTAPVLRRFTL